MKYVTSALFVTVVVGVVIIVYTDSYFTFFAKSSRPETNIKNSNSNTQTIIVESGNSEEDVDIVDDSTHVYPFNTTASCVSTPYVLCNELVLENITTNDTFHIALLRKPSWLGDYMFNFSACQYSNCVFQKDNIDESTRMVLLLVNGLTGSYKPAMRWQHQLYVATTWESPHHATADFYSNKDAFWNSGFNLSATYRTDSDIFVPYSKLKYNPIPIEKRPNYYEIAKQKTKWAVWIVSNCQTQSRRDKYVRKMMKIIDVEIYGSCGRPCPQDTFECSGIFFSPYRYYLSFENSFCTDYITEKFFKLFSDNAHVIPVARGAFDYNKYLPNATYITAGDFKSAEDLAQFLKRLGEDPVAYGRYLERKDSYRQAERSGIESIGCQGCKYLHTRTHRHEVVDMKRWMVDGQCYEPKDL